MSVSTRIDWNTLSSIKGVAVRAKQHLHWLSTPRAFYCAESFGRVEFLESLFYGAFDFHSPHVFGKKTTFPIRPGRLLSAHISIILVSHTRWDPLLAIWVRIHPALRSFFLFARVSPPAMAHVHSPPPLPPYLYTFPVHTLVFMKRCYFSVFVRSNKPQTPKYRCAERVLISATCSSASANNTPFTLYFPLYTLPRCKTHTLPFDFEHSQVCI